MTKPTQKKRLSRFVPNKGAFPDLVLRDRDFWILRLVYDHRFLSSELLWHLLQTASQPRPVSYSVGSDGKQRPTDYGFGRQALSKRLKQLFNARYLERHYITDQPMGRGHGSPRAIYGLGPACPRILQEKLDIPPRITRRIIESNRVKSPFLRHALEVATFRAILELACRRHEDKVKLLFWEQGDSIRDGFPFTPMLFSVWRSLAQEEPTFSWKLIGVPNQSWRQNNVPTSGGNLSDIGCIANRRSSPNGMHTDNCPTVKSSALRYVPTALLNAVSS